MSNCGDFSHELIERYGLFDLKNAQIIRAEIDSIDRVNNTAAVTLLDECLFIDWLDLADVPIFYHCEFSTGTIEDLAQGHLAFAAADIVYILTTPPMGETVPAKAYIIGHVDIRGTQACLSPEYLVINILLYYNAVEYNYTTIFDASTGAKLNLTEFESLSGSPAAPTSFPCVTSTATSWLAYNFEAPTAPYETAGGFIDITQRTAEYGLWAEDIVDTPESVAYSGQSYGLCTSFSTGNGLYTENLTSTYTGDNPDGEPVDYSVQYIDERTGATRYELGDTYCRAYWTNRRLEYHLQLTGDRVAIGTLITIGATHTLWHSLDWVEDREATVVNSGDITEIETSIFSYNHTLSYTHTLSCDTVSNLQIENTTAWNNTVTGTLGLQPTWDATTREVTRITDYSSTQAANELPDPNITNAMPYRLCPWLYTMSGSRTFRTGRNYVYGLIGATSIEYWQPNTNHSVTQYQGESVWPSLIIATPNLSDPGLYIRIIPKASTSVALIENIKPVAPETYIDAFDCIQQANPILSAGLNTVINELIQHVITAVGTLDIPDTLDFLNVLKAGPTAVVRVKKEL